MYKKLTALAAALLIAAARCGKIDDQGSSEETENASQAEESTEEAPVTETVSADGTAETTSSPAEETSPPSSAANAKDDEEPPVSSISVLSSMKTGMTEDEVLSASGMNNYTRYEENSAVGTYEYEYAMDCDNVFGTDLAGYMFAEFDYSTHKLICCGYHLGRILTEGSDEFNCSEEQLSEAYNKIKEQLIAEYGNGYVPQTVSGEGIRQELMWEDGCDQLWVMYGIDLWNENSGVNEIVVSRSINR
ncbi:MAG: hypothetical protein K6G33_00960 [Ruminococcus sp.]|uniref:hypothetical protein n=1 Tax=Ruminococcus sp. TaxID=41978 RepID=UPI0025F1B367|nr:hypothetical protein [Ruminococcus sp.]MCR5599304.1 hypothetical protein [Ruminococcus sp.]